MQNRKLEISKVSVLGLGNMGFALAEALVDGGHITTVWNRTSKKGVPLVAKGAISAESPGDAISASNIIIICVSGYEDVYEILEPEKNGLFGKTLVNLSSGTFDQAITMSDWADNRHIKFIAGAAMSGIKRVGQPNALFLFGGSQEGFEAHRSILKVFRNCTFLGPRSGLVSLYDTALFGMAWGALMGYYHAAALLGRKEVNAMDFTKVATEHLPFISSLMTDHAEQVQQHIYPADDGNLAVHTAAMDHLVHSSSVEGINTVFTEFIKGVLESGVKAGYENDGIASIFEVLTKNIGDLKQEKL